MRTLLLTLFIAFLYSAGAQPPAGYYDAASGKTGAQLKTALYTIIKDHTVLTYTPGLWNAFYTTDDQDNQGILVWDMYSNCNFALGAKQCGNYSIECDCYNREHSFPQSWFGSASPMVSDLFHIYATDGKVNGMRDNYPYGKVTNPTYTSGNGSKLGPCSFPGYTGIVFEPIDQYKGDLARGYFYMATRYENLIATWKTNGNADNVLNGTAFPCYDEWFVNLLLNWNISDPVSQKEIDRNNVIYTSFQHNRNPFIDHPEYANSIWGTNVGLADAPSWNALQVYPNPVSQACTITLPPEFSQQNVTFTVYSSTGKQVNVPLSIAGGNASADLGNLPSGFYLMQLSVNDYHTLYQARIIKK